ncbi:MAG TPA: hypothetical protein VGG85_02760 [Terracidiphilus sp.]
MYPKQSSPSKAQTGKEQDRIQQAEQRAERAEQELSHMRDRVAALEARQAPYADVPGTNGSTGAGPSQPAGEDNGGIAELRRDSMMAHLLDSLDAGKDIGHYGRLVFAMIAHHFLPEQTVIDWLTKDRDFSAEAATVMLRQVEGRDYNPPRRERILEWQAEQEFPILPDANDPDCGNVYRNLKFPNNVYEHIQDYQEEKVEASQ